MYSSRLVGFLDSLFLRVKNSFLSKNYFLSLRIFFISVRRFIASLIRKNHNQTARNKKVAITIPPIITIVGISIDRVVSNIFKLLSFLKYNIFLYVKSRGN